MSRELIDHNPDLAKLWNEGFAISIHNNELLVHHVPYVTTEKKVRTDGVLVSELNLNANKTTAPAHTIFFAGEYPCKADGTEHPQIINKNKRVVYPGVEITCQFSSKKVPDYVDYYDKITTYVNMLTGQAQALKDGVSAQTFQIIESKEENPVFHYIDTNSGRAEINPVTDKLRGQKIAIIGMGGTGSYILDFIAKTPVAEIHLFDGDDFVQHNAFRAPGAASIDDLRFHYKKTDYFQSIYSKMHRYIYSHPCFLFPENLNQLEGMSFVFVAVDNGQVRKMLFNWLIDHNIPFIDTGIGLDEKKEVNTINGMVRTSLSILGKSEHMFSRVSFKDGDNIYDQNIQVADLNALNAVFAVIKWKKLFKFYQDNDNELNNVYIIEASEIINDETAA